MKSKKILYILLGAFIALIAFSTKVDATLELNNLDFNAEINEDGSMDITETWDIYISETNTLFKTFKRDTSKYSSITDVKVTEITDGKNNEFKETYKEMYHVTKNYYYGLINSNGLFEIAWGVGLDNSSATRKYQISYTVTDAIAKYNDFAELYWQFIGEDFEIDAEKITGTIILPYNVENKEDIRVWGHTEDLNGEIYVTDLNKIEFTINKYSSGNYVEVRSLMPDEMISTTQRQYNKDILESVLKEENQWADEANTRRKFKQIQVYCIAVAISVIVVIFIINAIKSTKKLFGLEKRFKPTTKLQYFRELPYENATPAEALFILTSGMSKTFSASFSANILDLCLNKHLSLEVVGDKGIIKSNIVKIIIKNEDFSNLKDDEKLTLEFLKDVAEYTNKRKSEEEKNIITTKDITKYLEKHESKISRLDEKIEKIIEKEEIQKGNYIKENDKNKNNHVGKAVIYGFCACFAIPLIIVLAEMSKILIPVGSALIIVLIINTIINGIISSQINVFSQKGIDEKEQWKALKKYMEEFSLLKEKEVPALAVWEKYLVFATAFGISEKVLKQLKVIYPEIIDIDSTMYTYSYIHIMNSVNIGNCINSSVYSAISSSGSGAGGGFSAGGGGGRRSAEAAVDASSLKLNKEEYK